MTLRELFSDIKLLSCEVLGFTKEEFLLNDKKELTSDELVELKEVINERLEHKPVAYILSHKDFYKSTFFTPENVLIPQPDSEVLVEKCVKILKNRINSQKNTSVSILDLCSGTGCIGISIAKELSETTQCLINLYLTDISVDAYKCFSFNSDQLLTGLNVNIFRFCADLFDAVDNLTFDLISVNPPYIKSSDLKYLPKEVTKQPVLALDGGSDGLNLIKKIVTISPKYLKNNGYLVTEIGYNQGLDVYNIFQDNKFVNIEVTKDYNDNDRVVSGLCMKN